MTPEHVTLIATPTEATELEYVLKSLFKQRPDSALHRFLDYNGYHTVSSLVHVSRETLGELEYFPHPGHTMRAKLFPGHVAMLGTIPRYTRYHEQIRRPIRNWMQVTFDELKSFSLEHSTRDAPHSSIFDDYGMIGLSHTTDDGISDVNITYAPRHEELLRQMSYQRERKALVTNGESAKSSTSSFPQLTQDTDWDTFYPELIETVTKQGLRNVFDDNYVPPTEEDEQLRIHLNQVLLSSFAANFTTHAANPSSLTTNGRSP